MDIEIVPSPRFQVLADQCQENLESGCVPVRFDHLVQLIWSDSMPFY